MENRYAIIILVIVSLCHCGTAAGPERFFARPNNQLWVAVVSYFNCIIY